MSQVSEIQLNFTEVHIILICNLYLNVTVLLLLWTFSTQ